MAQILFNFISPVRWIFMAIDSILFGLVDACYKLIISFANAELFTSDQISEIRTKIYFVITLVAFFRLAFLLINSLINPDKLTDEQEGLSKIAFNFVIMLILLVITPIIFNIALDFQKDVVNKNVITGIFTLSKEDGYKCDVDPSDLDKIKRENYKKYDPTSKTWVIDEEKYLQDIEYKKSALCSSEEMKAIVIGSLIYPDSRLARETNGKYEVINTSACNSKCEKAIEDYNTMLKDRNFKFTTLEKYIGVTVEIDDSDVFVYNYTLIITTVCVGFMIYILLSFAFDLGKRLLEINLLMILSPLFIATYVDPKSAKSGPFNNWLKAFGSCYAGLFTRLGALAAMMLFVKILSINKAGLEPIGPFGFIILLFAGLTFCKELPKWISGLLGMKEGGMGELGLGKKLGATPLLGGAAKKAGYLAAGTAGAAAAGGWNALKDRSKRRGEKGLGYFRNRSGIDGVTEGLTGKERRQALRDARRGAYARDGKPENGGFFKQVGAGMLGSAIAGGRQAIKADNVKGAFQGSIKAADSFGKSVGNKGGTISGWVDEKLLAGTAFATGLYGSPADIFDAREQNENDAKARKVSSESGVISGNATGEPPKFAGKVIAMGKKGQIHMQGNSTALCTNAEGNFRDDSGGFIPAANVNENQRFALGKTYQAISCNGNGEDGIDGLCLGDDGKTVVVKLKGAENIRINGGSDEFKVSVQDAIDGNFGVFGTFAASKTEGAAIFAETYYSGQQTALQNYEQSEAALNRIHESINGLTTSIDGFKSNLTSEASKLSGNLGNAISSAISGSDMLRKIEAAKQNPAATDADKRLLEQMEKKAKYIAQQEADMEKLMSQSEAYAKERGKNEVIVNIIPGDTVEQKKIGLNKSAEKYKGDSSSDEKK